MERRFRWSVLVVLMLLGAGCYSTDNESQLGTLRALPTRVTCARGDDVRVGPGSKWCHAGEYQVCQGNGTWFNNRTACSGGTRGAMRAPMRVPPRLTD